MSKRTRASAGSYETVVETLNSFQGQLLVGFFSWSMVSIPSSVSVSVRGYEPRHHEPCLVTRSDSRESMLLKGLLEYPNTCR